MIALHVPTGKMKPSCGPTLTNPLPIGSKPTRWKITGAKYRGELQKWVKKNDEIINKRQFHKGF